MAANFNTSAVPRRAILTGSVGLALVPMAAGQMPRQDAGLLDVWAQARPYFQEECRLWDVAAALPGLDADRMAEAAMAVHEKIYPYAARIMAETAFGVGGLAVKARLYQWASYGVTDWEIRQMLDDEERDRRALGGLVQSALSVADRLGI